MIGDQIHAGFQAPSRQQRWDAAYEALQRYVRSNGSADVPSTWFTSDEFNLGKWVSTQRARYANGALGADRVARLEQLNGWVWNQHDAAWERGCDQLRQYVQGHGTAEVPDDYCTPEGIKLGRWVAKQRMYFRRGSLSAQRRALLEGLPGWSWSPRGPLRTWDEGYQALKQYANTHGTAQVFGEYITEDGLNLLYWSASQRHNFSRGRMGATHIALLEALNGWSWVRRGPQRPWQECYVELKSYLDAVPSTGRVKYPTDTTFLGRWVGRQRYDYSKGTLSPDRIALLERLPGWRWRVYGVRTAIPA